MPDEIKSNLEPIEDLDLNLKEKFASGQEAGKAAEPHKSKEQIQSIEGKVERREGNVEKEAAYTRILTKTANPVPIAHDDVAGDAKSIDLEKDAESKIKNLVNLAELKGIPHAVKVARHLEDNYVLDEFHDRMLAEELHNALVKKGMIREV